MTPRRLRGLAWIAIACGALVIAGLAVAYVFLPAQLVVAVLRTHLDPLVLRDVHGSAWHGEALRAGWDELALGHARWDADKLAALRGVLRAELRCDMPKDQHLALHVEARGNAVALSGLRATLVGGALEGFFRRRHLVPIGSVALRIDAARFEDGIPVALRGDALWRQATLVGADSPLPYYLGDLRIVFRIAERGVVSGSIADEGGPVHVAGTLRADPIGYRLVLRLAARDPRLAAGLGRLGEAQPDGSRLLVLQDGWWWKRRHA